MFLDFEDYRPETPRVPQVISRREGVLLSLLFHACLVIVYLVLPRGFLSEAVEAVYPRPEGDTVRYVEVVPRLERNVPAPDRAETSDRDRRSAAPERTVDPANPMPYSRGNTTEKVAGGPDDKVTGPETPPPASAAPPATATGGLGPQPAVPTPTPRPAAARGLGDSLRNLQQFLTGRNFDNQRGGAQEPLPEIQFDSKGVEFGPWIRRFVVQVKRNWFVPQAAMLMSGRVVITFHVHRNGNITDITVVKPSPIEAFNTAAVNALRRSSPTLPLPDEYPDEKVFFTVTFMYNEGLAP
jgi:TonB family protein